MNLPTGEAQRDPEQPSAGTGPKRLAIGVLGENFSREWLWEWTQTVLRLSQHFNLVIPPPHYSSMVCMARAAMAAELLKTEADYVLLIDDDNPPNASRIVQLITDLEVNPQVDLAAGWYRLDMGGETELSFGRAFKVLRSTFQRRSPALESDFLKAEAPELQEIDWTGLGLVALRWELLKACGPGSFLPLQEGPAEYQTGLSAGFIFDDLHFCKVAKETGARLFVDRRVRVQHLKLRDITGLPPVKPEEEPPAPVAGTALSEILEKAKGRIVPDSPPLPNCGIEVPKETHCANLDCCLEENHPGSHYLKSERELLLLAVAQPPTTGWTANAAPKAEPDTPEVKA